MYNPFIINWNTVPMTYNDSWTYLEMLGKCVTQIKINASKIAENAAAIAELDTRVDGIEARVDFLEENMVTREQMDNAIQAAKDDIAEDIEDAIDDLEDWCNDRFLTSSALEGYATETYVINSIGDALEYYYTIGDMNDILDVIRASTVKKTEYDEQVNTILSDINSLSMRLNYDGTCKLRVIDLTDVSQAVITDNVAVLTIPDTNYTAVQLNVSYTVADVSNTYEKNISLFVNRGTTGKDFVVYSMQLGGAITVADNNGEITVTIAKPSGTEVVTYVAASTVVYTAAVEPSAAKKQEWFRKADANGDGMIDSRDASIILGYYAALSSGQAEGGDAGFRTYCENHTNDEGEPAPIVTSDGQYIYPDANLDGKCNAVDASYVLTFYTEVQTGHYNGNAEGWYQYLKASHVELN